MLKEVAIARLTRMAAADVEPQLDALDLEYLLAMSRLVDEFGRSAEDPDWIGTWNLNRAAAKAWEMKAGKCSDKFNFSSDVNSFQRTQVFDHCIKMADRFGKKVSGTISASPEAYFDPVIGNLNSS